MSLFRDSSFRSLWIGQTISQFGTMISRDGLPLLAVLVLDASPFQMGLLVFFEAAPVLLFGLAVGAWVDRVDRKPLLVLADLSRALFLAAIPISAIFGVLRIETLFVIAAIVSMLSFLFDVACASYVPTLVGRDDLVEANGRLQLSASLAEIGGPGLAGLLIQTIGAPFAILVDSVSYLFSAFFVARISKPEPKIALADLKDQGSSSWQAFLTEAREGLGYIFANSILKPLVVSTLFRRFFGAFLGTLYALYAIRELGLTPLLLGLLIAGGGIGELIGALGSRRLLRRLGIGRGTASGALVSAVMLFVVPLAGSSEALRGVGLAFGLLLIGQLIGDSTAAVSNIGALSIRQLLTPDLLLGRVGGSIRFLVEGIGPLGALVAGILAELTDPRLALSLFFSPVAGMVQEVRED